MNFSHHKIRRLLLALLTGVYLAANGFSAPQTSTATGAKKPAAHSPAGSTQPTAPSTATKKAGAPTATSRPTSNPGAVAQTGAVKSATTKPVATKAATTKAAPHTSSPSAAKGTANKTVAHAPQRAGTAARYRRPRTLTGQQRLARLRLQPGRVQEIQQALIREGYLHGDANGQWDAATHDAMLHFQTDHGFPPTGLPEAKSLMKLGLGSHPLPPELDHGPVAGAGAQGDLTVTAPLPPVSQATPPSPGPSAPPPK